MARAKALRFTTVKQSLNLPKPTQIQLLIASRLSKKKTRKKAGFRVCDKSLNPVKPALSC